MIFEELIITKREEVQESPNGYEKYKDVPDAVKTPSHSVSSRNQTNSCSNCGKRSLWCGYEKSRFFHFTKVHFKLQKMVNLHRRTYILVITDTSNRFPGSIFKLVHTMTSFFQKCFFGDYVKKSIY